MKEFYVKGTIYGLEVCIRMQDARTAQEALRDVYEAFPAIKVKAIYNKAAVAA